MAKETRRDDALILALALGGLTVRSAAKASGFSERQAHRKVDDPAFRRRVGEARAAIVGQAVGILSAAGTEAARTLRKLLASEADQVRLAAGRCILELGNRLRETTELAERIEALECVQQQHVVKTSNGPPGGAIKRGVQ